MSKLNPSKSPKLISFKFSFSIIFIPLDFDISSTVCFVLVDVVVYIESIFSFLRNLFNLAICNFPKSLSSLSIWPYKFPSILSLVVACLTSINLDIYSPLTLIQKLNIYRLNTLLP